jgi:prefoldin subunit 5
MEEFKAEFTAVKEQEAAYDALLKEISTLEENIRATGAEIENVRVEIDQAKRRVIQLARQTEEEYERFSFELARAELGQRLLIELQIQDIESIKEAIAKLEQRLAELSAATLVSSAVEAEAPTVETSEN